MVGSISSSITRKEGNAEIGKFVRPIKFIMLKKMGIMITKEMTFKLSNRWGVGVFRFKLPIYY